MWSNAPTTPSPGTAATEQAAPVDTLVPETPRPVEPVLQDTATQSPQSFGKYFSARVEGNERLIFVETDLYKAIITTRGGLIKEWELKKFTTWNGYPVQLVDYNIPGDMSLRFISSDGRLIETGKLFFDAAGVQTNISLSRDDEREIRLVLPASNGGTLTKIFRFRNGSYDFDVEVVFDRMADVVANYKYEISWESGLRYSERNSVDESNFSEAHIFAAGEHSTTDATSFEEPVTSEYQGSVDWVAITTKYFLLAILPEDGNTSAVYLKGTRSHAPDKGIVERYSMTLEMPYKGAAQEREKYLVYFGPADYHTLKEYDVGLENVIYLGWTWIVRPISVYIMLPVFSFLHMLVPNWGIVLIIFAIIIKVVLHPLTKTSMKSMKKMQALQPMMDEIRTKYKDDPQKMNQQIMGLYKEYGVNPAGGCLPMVLQFPILIALYNVFRSAIQLRQAGFFWWISDLSIPDVIVTLPFSIPIFGIQEVSGLAVLMGITTFIQQKMSVKDPRQKAMVWMMPLMMTLLFNSFPSGLNLYYFMFNLLSIGQQMYINKQHDQEPLRKVDRKKKGRGGVFGKLGDIPRLNKKT